MADQEQQILEGQLQTEAARQQLESREIIEREALEEQEIAYANQLAAEQEADFELDAVEEEVGAIYEDGQNHSLYPFSWNYLIYLIPLAATNDLVDMLAFIPVIGDLAAWFVSLFLSGILIFVSWFFNGRYKQAKNYLDNLEARLRNIEHRLVLISRTTRFALGTAKTLRKVPGMKGIARQIPRALVRIRKPLKPLLRSPIIKLTVGAVLEAAPILSWFPWSLISVGFAYFDERKMYKNAGEAAEEAYARFSGTASEVV